MNGLVAYVQRHHVALLALALTIGGGTAYAADHLPKNSVTSKQVTNNSLQGKDLKDGTVTGADVGDGTVTGADIGDGSVTGTDLRDGSITGADLADGTVGSSDLAPGVGRESHLIVVSDDVGGGATTVLNDPLSGVVTLTCNGVSDFSLQATLPGTATPGSVKIAGSDQLDSTPAGAASISQGAAGAAGGVVGFGAGGDAIGEGLIFYDTATRRVSLTWDVSAGVTTCTWRGTETIDTKPTSRPAASGPSRPATCTSIGAATCATEEAASRRR